MENSTSKNYLCYFIWIAIIVFVISLFYPFVIKWVIGSFSDAGTFGDSYGALNAIFSGLAFSGVIITILIQRHELELQRDELEETRKEFTINRITNMVYNQLERFEEAIKLLELPISNNFKPVGIRAIIYLDSKKELILRDITEEEKKQKVENAVRLYSQNGMQIQIFAIAAYNAMNVVKASLVKGELPIRNLVELKDIFFRNIGFIQLNVIEDISDKIKLYFELFKADDPNDEEVINSLDISDLVRADIFLKSINEFKNKELTEESIQEYRTKWIQEFGTY